MSSAWSAALRGVQRRLEDLRYLARTLMARELAAALLRVLPEGPHPREQEILRALRERANRVRLADLAYRGAMLWHEAGRPRIATVGDALRFFVAAEILMSRSSGSDCTAEARAAKGVER